MKKALIVIPLVALLLLLPLALTACFGPDITENDIKTFRGLGTRLDDAEEKNSEQDGRLTTLEGATMPDLTKYVTLEDYNKLKGAFDKLTDESDPDSLVSLVKALTASGGSSNPGTPSGQVTVNLINSAYVVNGTLQVTSGSASAQYLFTVEVVNPTNSYQYVSYDLSLTFASGNIPGYPDVLVSGTTLAPWGYAITYLTQCVPNATNGNDTTRILFTPTTTARIGIPAGRTLQVQNTLTIQQNSGGGGNASPTNAQWNGNLTGIVVALTPW